MRIDGRKRWALSAVSKAAAPALLRRGVLLVLRHGVELHDAAEGLLLAQLPQARAAALGSDLCCVLVHEGSVSLHRLASHLSLL